MVARGERSQRGNGETFHRERRPLVSSTTVTAASRSAEGGRRMPTVKNERHNITSGNEIKAHIRVQHFVGAYSSESREVCLCST